MRRTPVAREIAAPAEDHGIDRRPPVLLSSRLSRSAAWDLMIRWLIPNPPTRQELEDWRARHRKGPGAGATSE